MSSTITFYIARHGKTLMNSLDRVQGWCDSPLTQEGVEVAEYLGLGLQDIDFEAVYTSDLRRTRQTAEIVLQKQGQSDLSIVEVYGFREACFGSYESSSNFRMWKDAALYLQYSRQEDMYNDVFEGKITSAEILNAISELDEMGIAENFGQLENRTQNALHEIAKKEIVKNKNSNILIVAHGMSIIGMLLNLGGKKHLRSPLLNASVCKVIYSEGQFTVESMGDTSYIERGKIASQL